MAEPLRRYRVYGAELSSSFPFSYPLHRGEAPPDLVFECRHGPPPPVPPTDFPPAYVEPWELEDGRSPLYVYGSAEMDVLRYSGVAEFHVGRGHITCYLEDPGQLDLVENHLLGLVLSTWLGRQGVLTLHGSAVEIEGRAVVFLSSNGGGKTSLAATLMGMGHSLLTDDLVALREDEGGWIVQRGPSAMRMWPDLASHFVGEEAAGLPLVIPGTEKVRVAIGPNGFGSASNRPCPLHGFYVPDRRPGDAGMRTRVQALSPMETVQELLAHAFAPSLAEALGFHASRLPRLARLAQEFPARRLMYPSGMNHLPSVAQAVLTDAQSGPGG